MKYKPKFLFSIGILVVLGLVVGLGTAVANPTQPTIALGEPGLAFRHIDDLGTTGEPYIADGDHLNSPYGIGVDSSNNVWVAEWAGARAVKYNSSGVYQMSIGQSGINNADNDRNLLSSVADAAVDSSGNIWLVDPDSHRVVQYNAVGEFQSQLGVTWESGSDNDHFDSPRGVGLDSSGNVYVSDNRNHRIQVFDSNGTYITTIGISGASGSDNNHLNAPRHFAIDNSNLLYVADLVNHRVQIFDISNLQAVTYIATLGTTGQSGSDNNHFNYPMGVAVDSSRIYVLDGSNYRVQVFDRATYVYQSTLDIGSSAPDSYLADIAIDSLGNMYVVDSNMRVQVYDGSLTYARTIGAVGVPYLTDDSHYNLLHGIAATRDGGFVVVEEMGHRLIKLDKNGNQLWTVGDAGSGGASTDQLHTPYDVAEAANGSIYVADAWNNRVQIFDANGNYQNSIGGTWGSGNDELKWPTAVAFAPNGNIYVADANNSRIQIFNSSHTYIGTIGVTGVPGSDNNHFDNPLGIVVDSSGNVYVADEGNSRVQLFNSSHVYMRTIGATGICGDSFDQFCGPHGLAVDAQDRLYVTDAWNNRIQVFDDTGAYLTTISGKWGERIGEMRAPRDIDVAADGTLLVADGDNYRIQKYAPGVPGWKQVNINGFGNRQNWGAWALGAFNDVLYVSTSNSDTGAEVYRYVAGAWEKIVGGGFGDSTNVAVDWFAEFNGSLYASTWNNNGSGQIWRSATGNSGSWTKVVDGGFGDTANGEIMSMAVFGGYLYAGTWSDAAAHGAEIWRSSTGDSGSWTRVVNDTVFGDGDNAAILSMGVFNNNLYVVTQNTTTGGEVWRTSNGTTWTQVNTDGFGSSGNVRAVSLAIFDGQLYAGTWNSVSGAQIWRTSNGTTWTQVVGDGFGRTENVEIASLTVFDNQLIAVVGNFVTGAEVWRSSTGNNSNWQRVIDTGFGNGTVTAVNWDNITAVVNNQLYVGAYTTPWANGGGRVWQIQRQVFLPMVVR